VPGGNVETNKEEITLRTLGRFENPRDFEDLVIANINGAPVRLRDIGSVEDGTKEQRSLARLNGVPTVTLDIRRQSGANTVEVINGIKNALPRVGSQLPADVKLEIIRDQSRYIDCRPSRNSEAPDSRQHPRELWSCSLHAFVAFDDHRRGRDSVFVDFHVWHDAGAELHAQQRHHAGLGADGWCRDRRRDRRAGKHLPLH
jgi:hypothetical protein